MLRPVNRACQEVRFEPGAVPQRWCPLLPGARGTSPVRCTR